MNDTLQQELMDVLSESTIVAIPPTIITKAYACLASGVLKMEDYKRAAGSTNPERLIELVDHQWKNLDTIRQSLADGNEETLAGFEKTNLHKDIIAIGKEGRMNQNTIVSLQRNVYAGRTEPATWEKDLRVEIDRVLKVRLAEVESGILKTKTATTERGRGRFGSR